VLVLDTDHLSQLDEASAGGERLRAHLLDSDEEVAATIVSVEEQFRGWVAHIHRLHGDVEAQVPVYASLQRRLEFYAKWNVLPWDEISANRFGSCADKACASGRWT